MSLEEKIIEEIFDRDYMTGEMPNANKEYVSKKLQEHRKQVLDGKVEEIKNGIGYGSFGFTITEGKHKGEIAIRLNDLLQTLTE